MFVRQERFWEAVQISARTNKTCQGGKPEKREWIFRSILKKQNVTCKKNMVGMRGQLCLRWLLWAIYSDQPAPTARVRTTVRHIVSQKEKTLLTQYAANSRKEKTHRVGDKSLTVKHIIRYSMIFKLSTCWNPTKLESHLRVAIDLFTYKRRTKSIWILTGVVFFLLWRNGSHII